MAWGEYNPWLYTTTSASTTYTSWTDNTVRLVGLPAPVEVHHTFIPPAPEPEPVPDDPIEWLRQRVNEITELVAA